MLELRWIPQDIFLGHKFQSQKEMVGQLCYSGKDANLWYEHIVYSDYQKEVCMNFCHCLLPIPKLKPDPIIKWYTSNSLLNVILYFNLFDSFCDAKASEQSMD